MITVDFNTMSLKPGERVLDLGCGEGRHTINTYLQENVHAVGVDLCFDDVKTASEKAAPFTDQDNNHKTLSLSVANGLQLPFADHSFDKVICSEVLEHIPDYHGVLKEISRVLKPGGLFAASVPRFGPEWVCWVLSDEYHAVEGGHVRIFHDNSLQKEIEQFGFQMTKKHWAHALHSPFWWLKCALWEQQEESKLVSLYHRFLVWDMMEKPKLSRTLEKTLNPLIGKSVVMYFVSESE